MFLKVLYEDNHLIAVEKPAGVLTQGDATGDVSLYDMVKDYIRIKKGKPSILSGNAKPRTEPAGSGTGVFLGLLHRLDRPVSGIILFAKTSKGASRLSEQFRKNEVKKTYNAIVVGRPRSREGTLVDYLGKDQKAKKAKIATKETGKFSELRYKIIFSNEKYSLLEIYPTGGRFHQIRVQLAKVGFPILGDIKYGAPFPLPDKSIALAATSISFTTAVTKEWKKLSVSVPAIWSGYVVK